MRQNHEYKMFFFLSRSDCVEILKKCGDQNKFPEEHTAESICEFLSPADDLESCIPLDTYLSKDCVGLSLELKGFSHGLCSCSLPRMRNYCLKIPSAFVMFLLLWQETPNKSV